MQAGKINCVSEKTLCQEVGTSSSKRARLFIYSYISSDKGSLLEYTGDLDTKSLKLFCQDHLPRFSKKVEIGKNDFPSSTSEKLPQVLLLSTRKDAPAIWRVVSGLYHKRFIFYHAEVASFPFTINYSQFLSAEIVLLTLIPFRGRKSKL